MLSKILFAYFVKVAKSQITTTCNVVLKMKKKEKRKIQFKNNKLS